MSDQATKILSYWRAALADSQLGRGAFTASQVRGLNGRGITLDQLKGQTVETHDAWLASASDQAATISASDVESWFQGVEGDWVRCVVYPFVYLRASSHQHGAKVRTLAPEMYAPVSFTVLVNRQGEIISHGRPGIARELLEPSYSGQPLVLGALKDLDDFFDREAFPDWLDEHEPEQADRWSLAQVLEYCEKILDEVVTVDLSEPLIDESKARYALTHQGLIHKAQQISTAVRPLIETFDAALDANKINQVFLSIARGEQLVAPSANYSVRKGSFVRGRELGDDQKTASGYALSGAEGSVVSVSGPPGTGKTTLLQDIVANLFVEAAIDGREPPLFAVASTNNQAVTNVLDSFARVDHSAFGVLGVRWVDVPEQLGVFIASHQRSESAKREGYLIPEDVEAYEAAIDIAEEESNYLVQAAKCIPGIRPGDDVESATTAIQAMLNDCFETSESLRRLVDDFKRLPSREAFGKFRVRLAQLSKKVTRYCGVSLGQGAPQARALIDLLNEFDRACHRRQKQCAEAKQRLAEFEKSYTTIPTWIRSLRGAPILGKVFDQRIKSQFGSSPPDQASTQKRLREINGEFRAAVRSIQSDQGLEYLGPSLEQLIESCLRPTLFMLALRYFEGKWLVEMKATLKAGDRDKRSFIKTERMWRRRSKLHPVMVSTLHSLPRHLNYWDHLAGQELPAFNFLDWLVVDEAGQVSVDVAGPSLLLTKRLIAVGDDAQIEPVWSISPQIDMGNLASTGLIDTSADVETQFSEFCQRGISASTGNLISAVKYCESTPLMLTGHRRCVPEIIRFCNELCYHGQLSPLRDGKKSRTPAVGYWHVPGSCDRAGGSRKNLVEAAAVAALIEEKQHHWLGDCDGDHIGEVVAVVTPFRQQALAIRKALKESLGSEAESITVGTIHSLQGAQRPVIVFSGAYSAHQNNNVFFDETPNMLNVAVSRAEDHFFFVGDMDVLRASNGPAKSLFKHLMSVGKPYAASWHCETMKRACEIQWGERPSHDLSGRTEHNERLTEILGRNDVSQLTIVTPILTPDSLRVHGHDLLRRAQAGTRIEIITSRQLNYGSEWSEMFARGCELLQGKGILVRVVDHLTHGALFINQGREWLITEGSWLGLDEMGAFEGADGHFREPESIHIEADNLGREHQRYRFGLGLEYLEPEGPRAA
jgi:hypothetical protein